MIFQVNIIALANELPKVYSDDVLLSDTETIIPIKIENNPGLMGYKISVKYDNKKIDVCSIIKGDVSSKGNFISNFGTTDGSFDVVWNNTENVTADGVLFSIFAKSKENITGKAIINISYSQADTFDVSYKDVNLICSDINVLFSKPKEELNTIVITGSEKKSENTLVADDSQIINAINVTLKQNNANSLDDVKNKKKFLKNLNDNINIITNSYDNNIVDFNSLNDTYINSYINEFIRETIENIEFEKVQEVINEHLKKYHANEINDVSESDRKNFIQDVINELQKLDPDIPNIIECLSIKNSFEAIKKLDLRTKVLDDSQPKKIIKNSNTSTIYIVVGIVACLALLLFVLVFALKKKK